MSIDREYSSQRELDKVPAEIDRIVSALPNGFAIFDRQWRYTYANDRLLEIFNLSRAEVLGKPAWEVFPHRVGIEHFDLLNCAMTDRVEVQFEFYYELGECWVEHRVYPTADGVAILMADISDRKRIEIDLHESAAKFRAFVSTAADVIYEMSADWQEMLFLEGKGFIATTADSRRDWMEEYIPETETPRVMAAIDRSIATRSNFELEHRVMRLDGTVGWMFSRAIPLLDKSGEIVKWFGAATDITERKQAEAALRESEENYRSLFNSIDEGFCIVEAMFDAEERPIDYRFLQVNPAFFRLTGLPTDAVGKTALELIPDLERFWVETYGNVALTGESVRFENESVTMQRSFDVYASRVGDATSRRVAIVFNNITQRKQAEKISQRAAKFDAFRVALTDALRSIVDPVEIQATASRVLGEYLGANRVLYFEMYGDNYVVERDYVNGAISLVGNHPIDLFGSELLVAHQSGRTVSVSDVANAPHLSPAERSAFAAVQIGAHIDISLIKDGEFVAGLAVHSAAPRVWTPDEVALVEEVAERTWGAIERARAEAALRHNERMFSTLVDNAPFGVYTIDAQFRLRSINVGARDVFQGIESPLGRDFAEILRMIWEEPFASEAIERFRQTLATGESFISLPIVEQRANIEEIQSYDWQIHRVMLPDSGYGVVCYFYDLSAQKRLEAAVAADLRDTQLLQELGARLVSEGDFQTLYQEIISAAISLTHADAGTVQILDETTQELVLLATQGFDLTMTDRFHRVDACSDTSCGIALRSGERTFVDFDVPQSEDPHGAMRMHVAAGYFSAQSTPLIARSGRSIGMVSTHWHKRHRPSERELRFLDLLARPTADSIEQRQTAIALRDREQQLRLASEAAQVGMWFWNLETDCLIWTEQCKALFGLPVKTEMSYAVFLNTLHPDDRNLTDVAVRRSIAERTEYEIEYRCCWTDGSTHWIAAKGSCTYDSTDKPVRMMGVAIDITDRKQAEIALAERNQELDSFVHIVSHDLKAPLRAISNLSVWIEEDFGTEISAGVREQMGLVRDRVHRMEAIIDGLLQYARIGRTDDQIQLISVAELLAQTIDSLAPPATFEIVIPPDLPTFHTKGLLLSQVFANSIGNAIKHHERTDGCVRISCQDRGDVYEFAIADDGPGIPPEQHERVFVIFNSTKKTQPNSDSTGIGLSIVKKIVETVGGQIWLESSLGQGATFYFTWPKQTVNSEKLP